MNTARVSSPHANEGGRTNLNPKEEKTKKTGLRSAFRGLLGRDDSKLSARQQEHLEWTSPPAYPKTSQPITIPTRPKPQSQIYPQPIPPRPAPAPRNQAAPSAVPQQTSTRQPDRNPAILSIPPPVPQSKTNSIDTPRKNHNFRVTLALNRSDSRPEIPEWYVENAEDLPRDHPHYLCPTCRRIDLRFLFLQSEPRVTATPNEYIRLGPFTEIAQETSCKLCSIVASTLKSRLKLTTRQQAGHSKLSWEEVRDAEWFLSPFVYCHEQYNAGYQLFLRHNVFAKEQLRDTSHTLPSHPFVLRLITDVNRGGRVIPNDHLDFSWIRTTLNYCDLSTEQPTRKFQHQVLVIDVVDMCVTDLQGDDKYAALSYPWGNAAQVKLLQESKFSLRQDDSLRQLFGRLPRTIQDALILVAKVGVRYLWVDSLCIIQDDETHLRNQMGQMGEIYRNSHFTIFAISGNDANYGLPGVGSGTRKITQKVQIIRGLKIANSLPWMEEEDLLLSGAWGTRGWTFQERFRSQRGLFIGDNGMIINCWHTFSPEDEHCMHPRKRDETFIARGTVFYAGQDKRCEPYLKEDQTTFDNFAQYVYEYSSRQLSHQSDALPAFLGVIETLEGNFKCQLLYGHPESEFDAALLWSPVGPGRRREEFPSWSWLGWEGSVAYPWTHERNTFMSIEESPLRWLDATVAKANRTWKTRYITTTDGQRVALQSGITRLYESPDTDAAWFTSDDLCLPNSANRTPFLRFWLKRMHDYLGTRGICRELRADDHWGRHEVFQTPWPNNRLPTMKYVWDYERGLGYVSEKQRLVILRTLSAQFYVCGKPFRRKRLYNMQNPIWRLSICDEVGNLAGYIDIPDPTASKERLPTGSAEFVVLSRSTIDGKVDPAPDALEPRRRKPMQPRPRSYGERSLQAIEELMHYQWQDDYIDQQGWFDKTVYDATRPWCMFNVLMLGRSDDEFAVTYVREAIGRIHVDAFLSHQPAMRVVELV